MVSGTCALPKQVVLEVEGEAGQMTYAFTHGEFSPPPPPSLPPKIPVLRPKFQSRGPNPSLEAQIPGSKPKFQPKGPNHNRQKVEKEKIPHV